MDLAGVIIMRILGIVAIAVAVGFALIGLGSKAGAREFGGYDCSESCSGHAAGYRWAEAHGEIEGRLLASANVNRKGG